MAEPRRRKPTARQQRFIDGIVKGLSQSEAYRQAGYKVDVMSPHRIAEEACKIAANPNIYPIIKERLAATQEAVQERIIWDKQKSIETLAYIAEQGRAAAVIEADEKKVFNHNAANAAAGAVEKINKMLGFNEPEKQEIDATISVELGEAAKYAK